MSNRSVSVSRTIQASPAEVFAVIADPSMHAVIDGSGSVKGEQFGPDELTAVGDRFGMKMKMYGIPYRISNTVVEFEQDRRIAWAHFGGHRWRYEFEPDGDATIVTETFDWSTAKAPKGIELMGYPKRHPAAMEATLERLAAHLAG